MPRRGATRHDDDDNGDDELFARIYVFARASRNARSMLHSAILETGLCNVQNRRALAPMREELHEIMIIAGGFIRIRMSVPREKQNSKTPFIFAS